MLSTPGTNGGQLKCHKIGIIVLTVFIVSVLPVFMFVSWGFGSYDGPDKVLLQIISENRHSSKHHALHGPVLGLTSSIENPSINTIIKSKTYPKFSSRADMMFIHVPKCAGTAFTTLLRKIQCARSSKMHGDCCRNPGSCFVKAQRTCVSIAGCVGHYPRM
jgi:hypothetical protein